MACLCSNYSLMLDKLDVVFLGRGDKLVQALQAIGTRIYRGISILQYLYSIKVRYLYPAIHIYMYLEVCSRGWLLGYIVECPGSNHGETCGCNVVKGGIHICVVKHMNPVGVGAVENVRATLSFS